MYAELYAIVTALLRGLSAIPTRKGLQHGTPDFSVLIYLVVNSTLLWGVTFFLYPISVLTASGVEYFVFAGILAPGVGRLFRDRSFSRLGVAVSSPIVGTYLLFSVLGVSIFLGEEVTPYLAAGAVLVLLAACGGDAPTAAPTPTATPSTTPTPSAVPTPTLAPSPTAHHSSDIGPVRFDAGRAFAHVEALAVDIGSRPAGSAAEREAAVYLRDQLRGFGYETKLQPFSYDVFADVGSSLSVLSPDLLSPAIAWR